MRLFGDTYGYGGRIDELFERVRHPAAAKTEALAAQTRANTAPLLTAVPCRSLQEIAPRLPQGEHYLDFTGSSLYWNSQVEAAMKVCAAPAAAGASGAGPASTTAAARAAPYLQRRQGGRL